ncbi:hypothetical protein [Nocardiopsis sp. NRRL B-16309]|uniref:hypothetical protein n=1 Tax=Nocardiopsis sp. NRRL B-16309 TaxID=1519494 RepID=UPI0006AE4B0B|nr:hypothetical protein [Nocardiopsis sp. NRRL B-16309]KOX20786.1 hypothetical protein ADL05_04805 [Nocardiopsis sp. NRRL B-16309]
MWGFRRTPARHGGGAGAAALVSAALGTDPVLRAGCASVAEGGLDAGLTLLAETRGDPEARAYRAEALGRAAADEPARIAALARTEADTGDGPRQADVLLWLGHALLAGAVRRSGGTTPADRKGAEAALDEARGPFEAAALLDADDAAPWSGLQTVAMGLGADRADKDRLWAETTARAPHLFAAHTTRVRTLSPTRGGSTEEMFATAGAAADSAPEGGPLPAVLALAHAEHLRAEERRLTEEGKSAFIVRMALGRLHGEQVEELFGLARAWVGAAVPHVRDVQAHHLFGWAFHRAGLTDAARWHLAAADGYVCDVPWSFFGDARTQVARAMADLGLDPARPAAPPGV